MVSAESTRQAIRRQMAVAERFAYFDHAAVVPIPLSSRQAIVTLLGFLVRIEIAVMQLTQACEILDRVALIEMQLHQLQFVLEVRRDGRVG